MDSSPSFATRMLMNQHIPNINSHNNRSLSQPNPNHRSEASSSAGGPTAAAAAAAAATISTIHGKDSSSGIQNFGLSSGTDAVGNNHNPSRISHSDPFSNSGSGYQSQSQLQHDASGHLHGHGQPSTNLFRRNSGGSSGGGSGKSHHHHHQHLNKHSTNATDSNRPRPKPKPKPKQSPTKPKNPLRVLGIALIVDHKGIGARMLARYPTSQSSVKKVDDEDEPDPDADPSARNSRSGRPVGGSNNENDDTDQDDDDDDDDDEGLGDDRKRSSKHDDDLFFTLTARQMAKLFRTKQSLCNQPMTLRVNKTVFCCHAILLDEQHETGGGGSKPDNDEKDRDGEAMDNELRLFSVVVALSASKHQQTALPFSSFWDTGSGEDLVDLERFVKHGILAPGSKPISAKDAKTHKDEDKDKNKDQEADMRWKIQKKREQTAARVSSTFLAIRRVHISLVRFCRALQREEHRCGYMTLQSSALFRTRTERQKQWEEAQSSVASKANASAAPASGGSAGDRSPFPRAQSHSRTNSFLSVHTVLGGGGGGGSDARNPRPVRGTVEREQEKEQEILELMLACNPQDHHHHHHRETQHQQSWYDSEHGSQRSQQRQHGNLVRDLVAVFHSLSRNDQEYPPTPSSLLCERDAVVYVNNHFAIPIDAAGLNGSLHSPTLFSSPGLAPSHHKRGVLHQLFEGGPNVLPYYTLLFPHASPSEMLQTFHASGSAPPQQLEHLLITVNPQKPLTQIAIDANLPMHTTMQIASFLVGHGACITSPVVTSRSRLTCLGSDSMHLIRELALEFSQAFPGINLFGVVSYLTTSSRHLGDAMAVLIDTDNDEAAWLREALLASPKYRLYNRNRGQRGTDGDSAAANETGAAIQESIRNGTVNLFREEKETYSPTLRPKNSATPDPLYAPLPPISVHEWLKDLEDLLYAIAVWLLSRGVLVQLQEYMVAVDVPGPTPPPLRVVDGDESSSSLVLPLSGSELSRHRSGSAISSGGGSTSKQYDMDEDLFRELMDMDYLNGDVSIMALSWRLAIDARKLRHFGLRHKRVRVISRVPSSGDDWEPAATTATATATTTATTTTTNTTTTATTATTDTATATTAAAATPPEFPSAAADAPDPVAQPSC